MRYFVLLFLSLSAIFANALVIPSFCESALKRALDADASWEMTRTIPGSNKSLVSTGIVSCAANKGIIWETRHPFVSTISMTTNQMIFVDEDSRRVKPLSEMPHYARIREACDAFLLGEPKAFDDILEAQTKVNADGKWTILFTPKHRQMRRILESIELIGEDVITKVVIRNGDGGVSNITFKEISRGIHTLWNSK